MGTDRHIPRIFHCANATCEICLPQDRSTIRRLLYLGQNFTPYPTSSFTQQSGISVDSIAGGHSATSINERQIPLGAPRYLRYTFAYRGEFGQAWKPNARFAIRREKKDSPAI